MHTERGQGISGDPGLLAWVEYLRDLGVYDLYRREAPATVLPEGVRERMLAAGSGQNRLVQTGGPVRGSSVATAQGTQAGAQDVVPQRTPAPVQRAGAAPPAVTAARAMPPRAAEPSRSYFNSGSESETEAPPPLPPELAAPMPKPQPLESLLPPCAVVPAAERGRALERLREEIGDCTRCPLAYAGRHTVVFGEGDPNAALMFVGEGPGADEDTSGRPFVGKAGQLLNNMIGAMGLQREQVYIANIVKCRPPGNRVPEFVEATTCSQFLLRQIDIVRPKVIVALGSTAATYLLGVRQSLSSMRGQWFRCRGAKVAVTYHPAFLLRDPRQKVEAWKDLQRVMGELGLRPPVKKG